MKRLVSSTVPTQRMKEKVIKFLVTVLILPMCMCQCVSYDKQEESDKIKSLQLLFDSRTSENDPSSPVFADSFLTIPEYREIRYNYRARGDYKLSYRIYKDTSSYYIYTNYYHFTKGNDTDDKIRKYSIQISDNKVKSILSDFRKFRLLGEYQNNEQYSHKDDPRGRTKGYFDYLILTFSSKKGPYSRYWVYTDGNHYYINFEKKLLHASPQSIKKSSIIIPAEKARMAKLNANFQSRLVYQTEQKIEPIL